MLAVALDSSVYLRRRLTKNTHNSVHQQSFQLDFVTSSQMSSADEKRLIERVLIKHKMALSIAISSCKNSLNLKILPPCARLCFSIICLMTRFPDSSSIARHPNGSSHIYTYIL